MVPLGDSRNRGRGGCLACSDFPSGALRFSSGRDRGVDCWGVEVSLELFPVFFGAAIFFFAINGPRR